MLVLCIDGNKRDHTSYITAVQGQLWSYQHRVDIGDTGRQYIIYIRKNKYYTNSVCYILFSKANSHKTKISIKVWKAQFEGHCGSVLYQGKWKQQTKA